MIILLVLTTFIWMNNERLTEIGIMMMILVSGIPLLVYLLPWRSKRRESVPSKRSESLTSLKALSLWIISIWLFEIFFALVFLSYSGVFNHIFFLDSTPPSINSLFSNQNVPSNYFLVFLFLVNVVVLINSRSAKRKSAFHYCSNSKPQPPFSLWHFAIGGMVRIATVSLLVLLVQIAAARLYWLIFPFQMLTGWHFLITTSLIYLEVALYFFFQKRRAERPSSKFRGPLSIIVTFLVIVVSLFGASFFLDYFVLPLLQNKDLPTIPQLDIRDFAEPLCYWGFIFVLLPISSSFILKISRGRSGKQIAGVMLLGPFLLSAYQTIKPDGLLTKFFSNPFLWETKFGHLFLFLVSIISLVPFLIPKFNMEVMAIGYFPRFEWKKRRSTDLNLFFIILFFLSPAFFSGSTFLYKIIFFTGGFSTVIILLMSELFRGYIGNRLRIFRNKK